MGRVIVGIDGSEHAAHALRWGVERSKSVPGEVVALMAWNFFDQGYKEKGEKLQWGFTDSDAAKLLAEAVEQAGVSGAVTERTVEGVAAEAITEEANPDDLIVVGARGLGGFKGLLLGSVSARVLQLAPCPVAVLHDETPTTIDGEVVVGVDGSEGSARALQWAGAEAKAASLPVRLVRAWQAPLYPDVAVPELIQAMEDGAIEQVGEMTKDPALSGLTVETGTPCTTPARALLAHDDAGLVVVGRSGHGAVARFLLGSVSRQVAQHAKVPVIVV